MDIPDSSRSNASHQYVYRVPSPPRIFVPPPVQSSVESSIFSSGRLSKLHPRCIWPNTAFLSDIELKHPRSKDFTIDWSYSDRQTAQEILPFLFLGPLAAARDKEFLESNQITMVLGVRKVMASFMFNPKAPRDLGLDLQFVDIKNEGGVINSFNELVGKINEHLERKFMASSSQHDPQCSTGRVLVFCESGNERSATSVAAYIMAMYGVNVVEAIQIIQGQRFCINIDDATRNKLATYGNMLTAQIDVLEANQQQQLPPPSSSSTTTTTTTISLESGFLGVSPASRKVAVNKKRNVDQMREDDSDVEMTGLTETMDGSFQRAGSAPFFDGTNGDNGE